MAKLIKAEPARYGVEEDKLWQTEKLLFSLKGQLLDGLIYQVCSVHLSIIIISNCIFSLASP
jgi:hypothetical protein